MATNLSWFYQWLGCVYIYIYRYIYSILSVKLVYFEKKCYVSGICESNSKIEANFMDNSADPVLTK